MKIQFTRSFNDLTKKLHLENKLPYKYEDEDKYIDLEIDFEDLTKEYIENEIGIKEYKLISEKMEEYLIELFKG